MHRDFKNKDDEFVIKDSQGNIEDDYYDDDFEPNQHIGSKGLK